MRNNLLNKITKMTATLTLVTLMTGCHFFTDLSDIGDGPQLSAIENPITAEGYKPVTMPMPKPHKVQHSLNSLWTHGSSSFFKDQRGKEVGDIITVNVNINDSADFSNTTSASYSNSRQRGISNIMGFGKTLTKVLPKGADLGKLVNGGSSRTDSGAGSISRSESLNLKVAAIITQVLPNGNLIIVGHQEARVNNELRQLEVKGVVRPQDIQVDNSISHNQIAEFRINYSGRGIISDAQKPSYGTQFFDIISPF